MPGTIPGKILGRTMEEVGASAAPGAALLRSARGVPVVKEGLSTGKRILQSFINPIKKAPGRAAAGELLASTTAGLGAGTAQTVFPDSPAAETWGQIIGGVTPGAATWGPVGLGVRLTKKIISRFSSEVQKSGAREGIEKLLGGALTDSAYDKLKRAGAFGKKAPGFKPTIAEATGEPGLLATQREIERNAQGSFLSDITTRRQESLDAIETFANKSAPKGDLEPEYIVNTANNKIEAFGERVQKQIETTVQRQKDLGGGLQSIDRLSTGGEIRSGIEKARVKASTAMSIRAQELGISDIDLSDQFNEWTGLLKEKYAPVSRFEDMESVPNIYKQLMRDKKAIDTALEAGKESIPSTFQDIKALRERITDDLIDSVGATNPNRRKVRFLTRLKKDVDGFVDSLDATLGEKYKQFRTEYFNEYVTPYESGVVFKVRSKDGTGFYKNYDETVADMFFGKQSGAKQYLANFSDNPEMMAAMEVSVLDNMQREVLKDGVVDGNKLAMWTKKYQDSLNELPTIKSKVTSISKAQGALDARLKQLAARKVSIENTALSKQIARYSKGEIPAAKVLSDALESPSRMLLLKSFIKNDEAAIGSLKKFAWDKAIQGTPDAISEYVRSHRKTLIMLFGPEHFQNIDDVVSMRKMLAITDTPKGKAYIPGPLDKIEEAIGMPIPQIATRIYAFKTGRLSTSYLIPEILRNVVYKKGIRHAEALFREALYDPNVAKEMAEAVRIRGMPIKRANRLQGRLAALGLPYIDREEQENTVE